jgi:cell division septation protein DedD
MNEEDYPEKPSGFLLGKEFILIFVIIFSTLSFTLGYFVGRKTGSLASVPVLQADTPAGQQAKQLYLREVSQTPELQAANVSGQQPREAAATETVSVDPGAPVSMQERQTSQDSAPRQKEQPKTSATEKDDNPAYMAKVQPSAEERDTTYTIQIGAFRSPAEARQLKAAFEKKGYETFIAATKNSKGQKIYKVKTGEFRTKKEAEVLALKLKKTEGLHTYVTTGTE